MAHQNQICYLLPVSLALSLLSPCLGLVDTIIYLYSHSVSRVWPHNLTEPGLIFHVPPIELRQLCVDSLKFRMDRPAPNWAASKWQHVRAQLAIVVADGAQICHQADCQLKIQPGLSIHHPTRPTREIGYFARKRNLR